MFVRALYRVIRVPNAPAPYDRLWAKVLYPAHYSGSDMERNTGMLPVQPTDTPYPVVIFFNGSNVASWGYQWLAEALVKRGLVVVLFDYVNEIMPNAITLTSGIDIEAVKPTHYGTRPTVPTLRPILDDLAQLNNGGVLAGALDLQKVILGGHSAGGTMALHSANALHHPEIAAIFTYAAHTLPAAFFGYPSGQVIPLADLPVLLLAGEHDGVIAGSRQRYDGVVVDPIELTYQQGAKSGRGDVYYIVLKNAGHFAITHPMDTTTGRHFLEDSQPQTDETPIRERLVTLIGQFIARHVQQEAIQVMQDKTFITHFESK